MLSPYPEASRLPRRYPPRYALFIYLQVGKLTRYLFAHRLLLEYFATLDASAFTESISSTSTE